jgi:predicted transcriptional regulator YdeE
MTVPPDVPVTGGVTLYDFPGGLYAAMTIREPFGDPFTWIPAGWQRLHQWVTDSPAYRATSGQCLEEVVVGEDHRDLVIYCPVTVAVPEPI